MATALNKTVTKLSITKHATLDVVIATWEWGQNNTDHWNVVWTYQDNGNTWLPLNPNTEEVTTKRATKSIDELGSDVTKVRVKVTPISKTDSDGKKYWTAKSTTAQYVIKKKVVPTTVSSLAISISPHEGTEDELLAQWDWNINSTDSFNYTWEYHTGDKIWLIDSEGSLAYDKKHLQLLYTPKDEAVQIRLSVTPIAKTYVVNGKETSQWVTSKSTQTYTPSRELDIPLLPTPSAPEVSISLYKMTITSNYTDQSSEFIRFYVVNDTSRTTLGPYEAALYYGRASVEVDISANQTYRAYCIALSIDPSSYLDSEQSDYSSEVTAPPSSISISKISSTSLTSVRIEFDKSTSATSITVQYTENPSNFDHSSDLVESKSFTVVAYGEPFVLITGLESGKTYYFRANASNDSGNTAWSNVYSLILGEKPDPPTTWSSASTGIVGDTVILYWTHNTVDESVETSALLTLKMDVRKKDNDIPSTITLNETVVVENTNPDSETSNFFYVFDPENFLNIFRNKGLIDDGNITKLTWSVQTKGVYDEYSDSSIESAINFYLKPFISIKMAKTNHWLWDPFDFRTDNTLLAFGIFDDFYSEPYVITGFPLYLMVQLEDYSDGDPVECLFSMSSEDDYQSLNNVGETVNIVKGSEIFSKSITEVKTIQEANKPEIQGYLLPLTPYDLSLENGFSYKAYARVIYNNGLYAEAECIFSVNYEQTDYCINAELSYDPDNISTYIQPYCVDSDGIILDEIIMDVYRRDFDGSFTEISSGINNTMNITVIDPHPTLKGVQYRIGARSLKNSKMFFTDLPTYPIPEAAIILQWDESWTNFSLDEASTFSSPVQKLSMVKLPYNIDTSESNDIDKSLVEYIGRKHPVSYYGTQIGQKLSLNCEIAADDSDTIYSLRRLSKWMGDVYVREPSGNGYWAQVSVSFTKTHMAVLMPITLTVTRVEGGA